MAALVRELSVSKQVPESDFVSEAELVQTLFGDRTDAEAVLAFLHGEPVGLALFWHNYSTFLGKPGLFLEDLFVRPQARGKGVGTEFMRYLAYVATQRHCGRFEWNVLDNDTTAIDYYKSLGCMIMDEWTIYRVAGDALTTLASRFSSFAVPI